MSRTYDVVVVGLGAMGSAAAASLAARGLRVLGIEQFALAHDRGSSHGGSRVIRKAYFEGPEYVPLVLRAYELWDSLEAQRGTRIFERTGGLMLGPRDARVVAGTIASAEVHGLAHEVLDAAAVRQRFPTFTPADDWVGVVEPDAGILQPERGIRAHCAQAEAEGATLRFGVRVKGWQVAGERVTLRLPDSETVVADRLVLTAGAWTGALTPELNLPLRVERMVQFWFRPAAGAARFRSDRHPLWIAEMPDGRQPYAFPVHASSDGLVKVAFFRGTGLGPEPTVAPEVDPDRVDGTVGDEEVAAVREAIAAVVPDFCGDFVRAKTCLYTTTPDQHFVLGLHPDHPQVVVASPCSGHGFKFAPAIGEILTDLAVEGTTPHPIAAFAPTRFRR